MKVFPERCLNVRLVKNIKNKRIKGEEICISNLSHGKYNLRIDIGNNSKFSYRITKMGIARKLLDYDGEFDKAYVSLAGGKNGT